MLSRNEHIARCARSARRLATKCIDAGPLLHTCGHSALKAPYRGSDRDRKSIVGSLPMSEPTGSPAVIAPWSVPKGMKRRAELGHGFSDLEVPEMSLVEF